MKHAALIAIGIAMTTMPAMADRGPSKAEAQRIAASLTAAGYKSWSEIEYDPDGPKWKVDDARKIDGKTYDLELTPKTYQIFAEHGD